MGRLLYPSSVAKYYIALTRIVSVNVQLLAFNEVIYTFVCIVK